MASKNIITPKGVAHHPWLNKPDTKFGDEKFTCGLILDAPSAKKVHEVIKELIAEEFGSKTQGVRSPLIKQEDGTYLLRNKSKRKPVLVDIKGQEITSVVRVGGGSVVKLDVGMKTYDKGKQGKGVTCYLNQVQIIKLVEYAGGSKFGNAEDELEEDEEGFVAPAGGFGDASDEEENVSSEDEASDPSEF